jgi:hypothetical protein
MCFIPIIGHIVMGKITIYCVIWKEDLTYMVKLLEWFTQYLRIRHLGRNGDYLTRWFVLRIKKYRWTPRIFIHKFLTSDPESWLLHSHPFQGSFSIILWGSYREERLVNSEIVTKVFKPGMINILGKDACHRVDLLTPHVWTLFFTGGNKKKYSWKFIDRNTLETFEPKDIIGDSSLEDID